MSTRIYKVSSGKYVRLVRASNQHQALRHVATDVYTTRVATQNDIVECMQLGLKVEDASSEPAGEAGGDAQ